MSFLAIVAVENNRISICDEFSTREAAQNHVNTYGGFIWEGTYKTDLYVEEQTVSTVIDTEMLSVQNRNIRNKKLLETDYFALTDVTLTAEMTTYRQALRDITSNANWPNLSDSDWPTKP